MENNKHPTLGNGKVCYIEIPALDINRSAEFYEKVFGWQNVMGLYQEPGRSSPVTKK